LTDRSRLEGRVVLVTGAGGDIGSAAARMCADRGAKLLLTDLPSERLTRLSTELHAPAVAMDLADAFQAGSAMAELMEHAVPDGLVHAAGMNTRTPLLELPVAEWDMVHSVNLRGAFLAIQAVARAMVDSGRNGSLVAVGSIGAWQPYPGLGHYEAAKAGVHALVRAWANALAAHRIRVNAVAPGVIDTTMTAATLAHPPTRQSRLSRIPLQRFGTPSDVAEAICFLLSGASDWLTGTTVTVDGGQSIGSGSASER
jgi:NAD(P)-dependent dehydrogenase (short-subunit alcohol dehydrogenase family)